MKSFFMHCLILCLFCLSSVSLAGGIAVVQIPSANINSDAVDNTETQKPTSSEITDLLTNNEIGPKKVSIDENNEIKKVRILI